MFCHKCGNETTDGAMFCHKCGTKFDSEDKRFDVILTAVGENKIATIAAVREVTGLGLAEAKALVESAPITLKKSVTQAEAELMECRFKETGASIKWNKPQPSSEPSAQAATEEQKTESPRGVHCPECKSENLQTVTETTTESKGGGYGTGRGCLGFLLLGPLGLLCGTCGSKAKISTINKTFFLCMDCGNKFREVDEFINEKRKESILAVIVGVICVALVVFVMRDEGIGWRIGLLVFGVVAIWVAYSNMKEREELEVKKYESECYKNQKK